MPLAAQEQSADAAPGLEAAEISLDRLDTQVIMGKAWSSFRAGRLGEALAMARTVMSRRGAWSEADYLIALVYEAEGELALAERHYDLALQDAESFYERPAYMYALANVYRASGDEAKYIAMLESIQQEAIGPDNQETIANQRVQARKTLLKEGLNRIINLYRWPNDISLKASEALGIHYYQQGTQEGYAKALENFIYVTAARAGAVIERLRYYNPAYNYTNLLALLDEAQMREETRSFLEESQFFRSLYFLACSVYAFDGSSQSKVLWNWVRLRPEAGIWAKRAERQFFAPYIETYSLDEVKFNADVLAPNVY